MEEKLVYSDERKRENEIKDNEVVRQQGILKEKIDKMARMIFNEEKDEYDEPSRKVSRHFLI